MEPGRDPLAKFCTLLLERGCGSRREPVETTSLMERNHYIEGGGVSRDLDAIDKVINVVGRRLRTYAIDAFEENVDNSRDVVKKTSFERFMRILFSEIRISMYGKKAIEEGQGSSQTPGSNKRLRDEGSVVK